MRHVVANSYQPGWPSRHSDCPESSCKETDLQNKINALTSQNRRLQERLEEASMHSHNYNQIRMMAHCLFEAQKEFFLLINRLYPE